MTNSTLNALSNIFVVSRDASVLGSLWSLGEARGWSVRVAGNAWEAMDKIEEGSAPDLLLLDAVHGESDYVTVIRCLRKISPTVPVILIGRAGEEDKKADSVRLGACGYVGKPICEDQFEVAIERSLASGPGAGSSVFTSDDIEQVASERFFIGVGPAMRRLRQQIELLATEPDTPVLILGERGSGMQTICRLIHRLSIRSPFEFAKLKCGALPEDLLERELVGSDPRDGNGTNRTKLGRLATCAHGTLLLDEITELPARLQELLLDVLKGKQFTRQGAFCPTEADVRVLASSSKSVRWAISGGRLREDFYHSLSPYTIQIPPLRERKDDLPILARHFMHRLANHYGLPPRELPSILLSKWSEYAWPGNLHELESEVKRYLMVGEKSISFEKSQISCARPPSNSRLSSTVGPERPSVPAEGTSNGSDFKSLRALLRCVRSEAEKNAIAIALQKTGWNRKAAARLLKVSYRTILYKIQQYQIISPHSGNGSGENGASIEKMTGAHHVTGGVRDCDAKFLMMAKRETV